MFTPPAIDLSEYSIHPDSDSVKELIFSTAPIAMHYEKFHKWAHDAAYEYLRGSLPEAQFDSWSELSDTLDQLCEESLEIVADNYVTPEIIYTADIIDFYQTYTPEVDDAAADLGVDGLPLSDQLSHGVAYAIERFTVDEYMELIDRLRESVELAALIEREDNHEDEDEDEDE